MAEAVGEQGAARKPGGQMAFAWIGMILAVAGPGVYFFLLDHAFLRSTGLAAFVLMIPGAVLGLLAFLRGGRWRVRLPGLFSVLMLVLFAGSFFWLLRLPSAGAFAELERAPDFTLRDHLGNEFTLSKELADGPVLLVFYRGFW